MPYPIFSKTNRSILDGVVVNAWTFETHVEIFLELGISSQIVVSPVRKRRKAKQSKQVKA